MKERELTEKELARFEEKIDKSGDCWLWTGCLNDSGYGRFLLSRKVLVASRLALFLDAGAPPEDKPQAIHSCRNRHCVKPSHLRWGSKEENEADNHGRTKLTKEQVLEIYRRAHAGEQSIALGEEFGVSHRTVSDIKTGYSWSHTTGHKVAA